MTTVSHSEVEAYITCERKWYYAYYLGIERIKHSEAMDLGNLGHEALQVLYAALKAGESYTEATRIAKEHILSALTAENGKMIQTLGRIFDFHLRVKPFAGFEVLALEKEYVLKIDDNVSYPFVIDAIFRDPAGKIAVVDNKFVYDFYQPSVIQILPQIPKYIAALRALGKPANYGIYHFLRYRNMKDPAPEQIVQTINMIITDERVVNTFREQLMLTERVLRHKSLPQEEASQQAARIGNGMVCKTCSFNSICSAELSGFNAELVKRTEYKPRERRTFNTSEEA